MNTRQEKQYPINKFLQKWKGSLVRGLLVYIEPYSVKRRLNSLPNDKFLDWSKLKAFSDDLNLAEKLRFVFGRVKNIVGKGENAGYQLFVLFPQCFPKASFQGS